MNDGRPLAAAGSSGGPGIVSAEVFAFVQCAQVLAGDWRRDPCHDARVVANLLDAVPTASSHQDVRSIAYVLTSFARHFESPMLPPWAALARPGPIAALEQMASDERIDLTTAARRLGYSKWHLSRLVREHTSLTFTGFIHLTRVMHAVRLLAATTDSIKQIAGRVGYRTTGEMDRQFSRRIGMSPQQVRRALRW